MECKLVLKAGEHARTACPVSVYLPWSYADSPFVVLQDAKSKRNVPCQVTDTKSGLRLTWLANGVKAGTEQALVATASKSPTAKNSVLVEDVAGERRVKVTIGGGLFTAYNYGAEWVRPFLYPVLGPGNTQVTRNWPMVADVKGEHTDHKHHKSIWVAYGECGTVDNWSEEEGHGWQRHRSFVGKTSGPVFGRITAKNDWCLKAEKKQFEETRNMVFYALPGGVRLFDIEVTFNMTQGPVIFRDTKEGGIVSVRVASSMDVRNGGRIENGYGGVNERETWGKNAPWCDYSGIVNGKHVGIAIIDHEDNPRYPTGWHVRNYGLMTANCFAWKYYRPDAKARGDMAFKKGSSTTWRYRLYIHRGDAKTGRVGDRFIDFIAPPTVAVE